jgi:hypothetical protein
MGQKKFSSCYKYIYQSSMYNILNNTRIIDVRHCLE